MKNQTGKLTITFGALLAGGLALAGGIWASSNLLAPASLDQDMLGATYLPEGRAVVDFQLLDHNGEPFTRDRFREQWTLVFFGFTNCPDICPMAMHQLAAVHERLDEKGIGDKVRTVFVTVDPERDTQETLAAYVPSFRGDFVGVTGDMEQIDVLARDLGIAHVRRGEAGDADYMVDHGSAILLISPEARLQAVFQAPHQVGRMSMDLDRILGFHRRQG